MDNDTLLCTADDLRKVLRIAPGFDRYDDMVDMVARIASGQVLKYIGKDISYGVREEYLSTPREGSPSIIRLAGENIDYTYPMEIFYDGLGRFDGLETELQLNTDYTLNVSTGAIRLLSYYDYAIKGIKVVYMAGYPPVQGKPNLLQVPAKYKDAATLQGVFLYNRIQSGSLGKLSEEKEGTSRTVWSKAAQEGLIGEARGMLTGSTRQPYVGRY